MNYYEHHLGDYLRDTAHLSMVEDGAYRRLLDAYYIKELPLPKAVRDVYRLVRAGSKVEKDAVSIVLSEFFSEDANGWRHKRCDTEIARYQDKQAKAKRSAEARWSASKPHSDGNANASPNAYADAMRTHSDGNALQSPVTRHQTPKKKNTSAIAPPDGVSDSVWQDFLKIRVAKKAPMTDTALDGIRAEAGIAGIELSEALKICCARGWQGFKAKWLDEKYSSPHGAQGQSGAAWEGAQ